MNFKRLLFRDGGNIKQGCESQMVELGMQKLLTKSRESYLI